jgi:hypothetical protein
MKSSKVFAQRLNQAFKQYYPTHNIKAIAGTEDGLTCISLYIIKRLKGWFLTRNRKIYLGRILVFYDYEPRLKIRNAKFGDLLDDIALEYFGDRQIWADEDALKEACDRARKNDIKPKPKPKKQDDNFNFTGAL